MSKEQLAVRTSGELQAADVRKVVLDYLGGLAETTKRGYLYEYKTYGRHVGLDDVEAIRKHLTTAGAGKANALILEYKTHLLKEGKSSGAINRALAALKVLIRCSRMAGEIPWHVEIKGVPVERRKDCRGPGADVVKKMFDHLAERTDQRGLRNYAILSLLNDNGLRRAELVGLDLTDIDLERGELKVKGKGRREKEIMPLAVETVNAIKGYLNLRGLNTNAALFINDGGCRLTDDAIYKIIKALGATLYGLRDRKGKLMRDDKGRVKLSIDSARIRPHGIRHVFCTRIIAQAKGDLSKAMAATRHKSISSLLIYNDQDKKAEAAKLIQAGASAARV